MRRIAIALAFIAAVLAGPLRAEEGPGDALERVIADQIAAFLADDFQTAFIFASPGIQRLFGTPERFGKMVRQGYPMVWRPSGIRYLERRQIGDTWHQIVQITDAAGMTHVLDYGLVRFGNGWRINGVRILERPGVGV